MTSMVNFSTQKEIEFSMCFLRTDGSEGTKCPFHPYIFVLFNSILSITSLLGNILILFSLQFESLLPPPSKLLFRCLSCTDLLVGLVSQPMLCIHYTAVAEEMHNLCEVTKVFGNISSVILCGQSITTLTMISVDRVFALLLRQRYRTVVTLKRFRYLVVFSWMFTSAFSITYLWDKLLFFIGSFVWIGICLIISSICYLKINVSLRIQQAQVQSLQSHPGTAIHVERYKKSVSSLLWIYLALILCYLPYTVATIAITSPGMSPCRFLVRSISSLLVFLNSTLNPFLYCWKIREVRQAVKDTLRRWFSIL